MMARLGKREVRALGVLDSNDNIISDDEVLNARLSKRKARQAIEKGLRSGNGQKRRGRDDSDTSISINKSSDRDWKPQRNHRVYLSDSDSQDEPPKRRATKKPRAKTSEDLKEHIRGKRLREDSRKDPSEHSLNEDSGSENWKKNKDGDKKTRCLGRKPSSGESSAGHGDNAEAAGPLAMTATVTPEEMKTR
ncbi:hypothetical protein AB5N19_04224 [Seiridium cardinale]